MRKALTTLAVTTAAFAAPMLASGTAYAADANITIPKDAIVVADIGDLAIPRGCTLTYVNGVYGTPVGPVVTTPPGKVVIDYNAGITYVFAITGHTLTYVFCL